MIRFSFFLILSITLLQVGYVLGQTFPVQTNLIIKPPYSLFLSDYVVPGSDKLIVNIFLKEQNRTNYPVRLRLTIEGPSGTIQTDDKVNFVPIYLNGGELTELTSEDLAPYFNPKNLIFQNGDKQRFLKTNRLDEGIYRIGIQVLDIERKFVVSNTSTITAWMFLNKPPMWNLPKQDEVVKATFPQNVYFNWLAMNKTSLNSAFTTEYEFTLVEIYPINRNPNDAILSQAPIFQETIENTSLIYDNNFPSLIAGRKYAVRLKAKDKSGLDLFENNGFSEVLAFTFGENCLPPSGIAAELLSSEKTKISWEAQDNHIGFVGRVKEKGNATAAWFEQTAATTNAIFTGLKPQTEYEYQVQGTCESFRGDFSKSYFFKTPQKSNLEQKIDCGNNDAFPVIVNTKPLLASSIGQTYKMGKFDLAVTEVKGGNGNFSGGGNIFIPYMNTTIRVAFNDLQVNENLEVMAGEARSLNTGLSLLSAADLAMLASENLSYLSKDICLPVGEDKVKSDQQSGAFKDGDVVITLGEIQIKKGDNITVNGKQIKADENTKFKPGDKVSVGEKIYSIGAAGEVVKDNKGGGSVNANNNGGSVVLSKTLLDNMKAKIKEVLEDIKKDNSQDLSENKKKVAKISGELGNNLTVPKLFREVFSGFNDGYIKEGMSNEISIPERILKPIGDKLINQYGQIRSLYVIDSTLQQNKRKDALLLYYLNSNMQLQDARIDSLVSEIGKEMSMLDTTTIKQYEKSDRTGNTALKKYLKEVLNFKINIKISDNRKGFGYYLKTTDESLLTASLAESVKTLLPHKSLPVLSNYWKLPPNELSILDTISPAVRAQALHKIITENGRIIGEINPNIPTDLPIGFSKQEAGIEYVVALEKMVFTPKEAWMDAFMTTEVPMTGKKITFFTSHTNITPNGIRGTKSVKMMLMKNFPMRISNDLKLTIKAENNLSFVEFDCAGFKSLAIEGEFEFCDRWIVPEGADGKPIEGKRVKARFNTVVTNWNDVIATINFDPFQLRNLKGVGFTVKDAVIDLSDRLNPLDIVFPNNYNSSYFIGGDKKMWQGFYIRQAAVKLPEQFKDKAKTGQRIEIGVKNLFIDNLGLTGVIYIKDLIPFENGDMKNWNYSLDTFAVGIQASSIQYARFSGSLNVPIFKENSKLKYTALINPNDEYIFTVATHNNVTIPMWKAGKVDLLPTSFIEIAVKDGSFLPRAVLNGKFTIVGGLSDTDKDSTSKSKLSIADISFEKLEVSTMVPYVKLGSVAFGSETLEQRMAKFPISIKNISVKQQGLTIGLGFDVKVNFMSASDKGFGGDANLIVWAERKEIECKNKYNFKSIEVGEVGIDINQGAYKIVGRVIVFKDDPIYGTGFKGTVAAEFKPGIKVSATALFGSTKTETRYWYVDAMVAFNKGIMVFTGFGCYGFGGGCYHNMSQKGFDATGRSIGASNSGIVYVPDSSTFLGLKATINIGTYPKPEPFNGDATFEIAFNYGGGIKTVAFYGNGYFATPPIAAALVALRDKAKAITTVPSRKESDNVPVSSDGAKGQISASIFLKYDAEKESLHGNLKVFVNVAGGLIKGTGTNNEAGNAVIHYDAKEWYVHIGTPDQRIGIEVISLAKFESYFMVGTNIPGSPPPPQSVKDILGDINLDYMGSLNSLGEGDGFAFGASLEVNTGNLRYLMFYANFKAGLGFDVMLKNYGTSTVCKGSTSPIGINGFYANGQAYGYFAGRIGIMVDLPFYSGSYDIINIGAAALLQAKLPNPFWMRGVVGGYYNILGGLVKGRCRFELTIGKECELQSANPLGGIKIISQVTPADGETNISVFTAPQAIFNMPIGKPMEIVDLNKTLRNFRIKLDQLKLYNEGKEIPGIIKWNETNDVAAISPFDILQSQKDIKIVAKVSFEENTNGTWKPVFSGGKIVTETIENTFKSGTAPDYLPVENVAYSYPLINQYNFYKDENRNAYIKLKQGMPELFMMNKGWKQVVRIESATGEKIEIPLEYNAQQVNFTVPNALKNGNVYSLAIVNMALQE